MRLKNFVLNQMLKVPIKALNVGKPKTLLVYFHGAINRDTSKPPVLQPFCRSAGPDVCHVSISDPTLALSPNISTGWYLGGPDAEVQPTLTAFFNELVQVGCFEKVIFVGARLAVSQACIFLNLYRAVLLLLGVSTDSVGGIPLIWYRTLPKALWPHLKDFPISLKLCTDVSLLRNTETNNLVVYLQSAGDFFHNENHLYPLIENIRDSSNQQFILISDYWGIPDHSGSVPPKVLVHWIKTLVAAPSRKRVVLEHITSL